MLFEGMQDVSTFPFLQPHAFGCSVFPRQPFFFFLLFREGGRSLLRASAWLAIGVLTFALWCHGNPGGWQFSYRYAMILLPWMFLLLVSNGPRTLRKMEAILFLVSVAINAIAVYQFLWTRSRPAVGGLALKGNAKQRRDNPRPGDEGATAYMP